MKERYEHFYFTNEKGNDVSVFKWLPASGQIKKATVQIAHGAAEHIGRYADFAEHLADHGYAVYGNDHRGHGKTAGSLENLGRAGKDGWNGMVRDCKQLTDIIRQDNPGVKVFLFGHSMGSTIARDYVQQFPEAVDGIVLSGSARIFQYFENTRDMIEKAERVMEAEGPNVESEAIGSIMAKYDSHFQEGTPLVWLTRDRKEVQKYVDDPFCGFPFCVELVRDWCRGLEKINKPEELNKMRRDLPVLFVTGEKDPANNNMRYIEELLADYKTIGMKDVTSKVYPDARHEVLNETNRQEVYRDIVHWLDRQLRS